METLIRQAARQQHTITLPPPCPLLTIASEEVLYIAITHIWQKKPKLDILKLYFRCYNLNFELKRQRPVTFHQFVLSDQFLRQLTHSCSEVLYVKWLNFIYLFNLRQLIVHFLSISAHFWTLNFTDLIKTEKYEGFPELWPCT